MTHERRDLKFDGLDQVIEDANRLLKQGYEQAGNWNLSQACGHLNDWMRFSMDGYPKPPLPIRAMLWMMKVTSGKRQFASVLKNGFREGLPTMPESVPLADATEDAEAVSQLTDTINRLKTHQGPLHPSPLYGDLTHDQVVQLQLVHCAHHLRYLLPKS